MAKANLLTYLQLDSDVIKIAQGQRQRSGVLLSALIVKDIKGLSEEETGNVLKEALTSLPMPPGEIELVLPRNFAIVRTVDLPSTDDAEIKELAGFQAVKQTPYALDEMVMDLQILSKDAEFSKVSMVIVQREPIDRLLRFAQETKLPVKAIRLDTQAFEATLQALLSKQSGQTALRGPVGFVSMDISRTHLLISDGGACRYSRSLPVGSERVAAGSDGQAALQKKLVEELGLSFAAYRKENQGAKIDTIVFEFDVRGWNELADFLKREGCSAPLICDPMALLNKDSRTRVDTPQGAIVCCGDMVGGLIKPQALTLDLLPSDLKAQKQSESRRSNWMQVGIFASLFVFLCFAYVLERVVDKQVYLRQIQNRLSGVQSSVKALESRNEKIEMLQTIRRGQGEVLNAIRELYRLLPDSVSLNALSYERGHVVTIKGTAKELSDVFQLIPVLEKSDCFENVTSQYATKRKINDMECTDFQIQCFLSKGRR